MLIGDEMLSQLKDIKPPPPFDYGWFSSYGGWLLALGLIILIFSLWKLWRWRKSWQREAWREWRKLRDSYQKNRESKPFLIGLSSLLRRVALARDGGSVAGVIGKSWIDYLNRWNLSRPLPANYHDCLLQMPYTPETQLSEEDMEKLTMTFHAWFRSFVVKKLISL